MPTPPIHYEVWWCAAQYQWQVVRVSADPDQPDWVEAQFAQEVPGALVAARIHAFAMNMRT